MRASDDGGRGAHVAGLAVNAPGDRYEREADRVARQVVDVPEGPVADVRESPVRLQRLCAECEEEQASVQRSRDGGAVAEDYASDAVAAVGREPGRPLGAAERGFFEPRFGADLSDVRVHTGARADVAARAVGARAYTTGRDVVLRSGAYAPGTRTGRRLLAHELTHVLQQRSGAPAGPAPLQREDDERPSCSITATRETLGTGFCVRGTASNVATGTRVNLHYVPGMTSCNRSMLQIVPPFGVTAVAGGGFYWRAPSNMMSQIPGVGRLMGAVIGSTACCTRVRPGRC